MQNVIYARLERETAVYEARREEKDGSASFVVERQKRAFGDHLGQAVRERPREESSRSTTISRTRWTGSLDDTARCFARELASAL